jgi:hypothetical protein
MKPVGESMFLVLINIYGYEHGFAARIGWGC